MLDMAFIRENPTQLAQAIKDKQVDLDINQLLAADLDVRTMKQQVEALRTESNTLSKQMPKAPPKIVLCYKGEAVRLLKH